MAKIVLIHGYGTQITSWFQRPVNEVADFDSFKPAAAQKEVAVFWWGKPVTFNWWQSLLPNYQMQVYFDERKLVFKLNQQQKLHAFLQQEQPTVIVTHSLGTELLYQTLLNYPLPKSTTTIISVQADLPYNTLINKLKPFASLNSAKVKWFNVWCWWDITLLLGSLLHVQPRAGVTQWQPSGQKNVIKNIFWPLWPSSNIHTSSIHYPALAKWIHKNYL